MSIRSAISTTSPLIVRQVCDLCHITLNKNSVVGDVSAATPGGVRVGTAAVTSRSMGTNEMAIIADFLDRAVQISLKLQVRTRD